MMPTRGGPGASDGFTERNSSESSALCTRMLRRARAPLVLVNSRTASEMQMRTRTFLERRLVNAEQAAGTYTVEFGAPQVARGQYFVELTTGSSKLVRKLTLLR